MATDMVSGAQSGIVVGGIPFTGPGVLEPPAQLVAKSWKTKAFANQGGEYWVYYWRLLDGRMVCLNNAKGTIKIWRPKKNVVVSSNPRMSDIKKLERLYNKVIKDMAKKSSDLVHKDTVDSLRNRLKIAEGYRKK